MLHCTVYLCLEVSHAYLAQRHWHFIIGLILYVKVSCIGILRKGPAHLTCYKEGPGDLAKVQTGTAQIVQNFSKDDGKLTESRYCCQFEIGTNILQCIHHLQCICKDAAGARTMILVNLKWSSEALSQLRNWWFWNSHQMLYITGTLVMRSNAN